jgi:hypothetical protein
VGQLSTPFKRTAVTFDFRASESGLARGFAFIHA